MENKEKYIELKEFHFFCEKNYLLFSKLISDFEKEKSFSFGIPLGSLKVNKVFISLSRISKFTSDIEISFSAELSKKIEIEIRLYHEAKMCEVIRFQGFHQSLVSIFPSQKKFGFTKDEKFQWNSFLNKFLTVCIESGRSLENHIPSRI